VVHGQAGSGWWLSFSRLRAASDESIQKYGIKVGRPQDPVSSLSGGNQQKVVVARVLGREPELVVALNPTRGLDVKAAEFVHQQLRAAAGAGAAVVLISTDRDELAALSSRIEFLLAGQWAASLAGA
jgi:simple sugar transport system ATP-binding protein